MKIQESAENYLETILILQQRIGEERSIDVVNELSYSKPSVSIAMKNLRNAGLVTMLIYLGVDPQKAVEDACRMEHILSAESFHAIKQHVLKNQEQTENGRHA